MKFRRMLAALLSAMMITSCMSFVAGAEEAETEAEITAIEEIANEEAEEEAEEEEVTVLIPAELFVEGQENIAVFSSEALYEIKWVDGEETVRTDAVEGGVLPTAPELTKVGHTFSGWSVTESFTMPDEDVTITGTFTKDADPEPIPTTPTYKTYGTYDAANGVYTVELKVVGEKINVGSFGFAFPKEYMTLTSVTANAEAGVVLLAEEESDTINPSPIFVKDTENGYYANTWTAELAAGFGYVDATAKEVLIATFEFAMTAQQRAAFDEVLRAGGYKFSEYVVTNADKKYHDGTNYLVAPDTPDLTTNKEAVVYDSHIEEVKEVEEVTIALKVNFVEDKGGEITSFATVKVNGEATVIESAGNTESAVYTIRNLTAGQGYEICVEKNGYIAGICEVIVAEGTNNLEMTLIAGDIKGDKNAPCGDGEVNLDDFVRIIRAFDPEASAEFKNANNINEDGAVNVSDLGYIKTNYSKTYKDVEITFNGEKVLPGIGE